MISAPSQTDQSHVYMYGLSDFWVDMFADKELVEASLSGSTTQLAEVYSYFLQRSAGISLQNIQDKYQTRIKLLLLSEDDLVDPLDLTRFRVSSEIVNVEKIANRPILPTATLSNGVHYEIMNNIIRFNGDIDTLKFPVRYTSDGKWQYALWMCDVEINEKWIDNTFGRLVGFTEEDAIFNYKSFLEGVYYLYANGPNLAFIERGVNLAMGMPYARSTEEVLDISQDALSGNWIVFTATQAYTIPYGYRPDISAGDTLTQGNVLSTWVEVRDYSTSGAWWYQIFLPRDVLGPGENPLDIGRAVQGSTGDKMMQNFLKHHMFEVLITQPNSDITAYNTARNLVLRAKPEYTFPVFVWKVPVEDELITMEDDFSYNYESRLTDHCVSPPSVRFMDRGADDGLFVRGTNWYNRCQGSMYTASLLGYGDWPGNGGWAPQFETIADNYVAYMAVLMRTRGDIVSPTSRGTIVRGWRGVRNEYPDGITWVVPGANVYGNGNEEFRINERELTPLYLMDRAELIEKMRTLDQFFNVNGRDRFVVTGLALVEEYDTWMVRNPGSSLANEGPAFDFKTSSGGLDIAFSPFAYQTYVPKRSDMIDRAGNPITNGTLMINRCTDNAWAVQWIREDISYAPSMFPIEDQDHLQGIEEYGLDRIGDPEVYFDEVFHGDIDRIQTRKVVEGTQDIIAIVDGKYVNQEDFSIEFEKTRAEQPSQDPPYIELDITSRTYVKLDTASTDRGFLAEVVPGTLLTNEETLTGSSSYTLTETVAKKEDILVISDGEFVFNYTVTGDQLNAPGTTGVTVRYVAQSDEQTFPSGETSYTLSSTEHALIFQGSRLMESWEYKRDGTDLTLTVASTAGLTVRYDASVQETLVSSFTRSTVEDNRARFLMDRSRADGVYDDFMGQVVNMNRSGRPTLIGGQPADRVNVIRRLR